MTEFPSLSTSWRGGGVGLPHLALGKMAIKCFFADPNDAAARTDAVMSESSRLQKIANCLLRHAKTLGGFFNRHHGFPWTLVGLLRHSEEPSFHLVAVDGPVGVGLFFPTVEFEVRTGADLFDELAEAEWLATVDGAASEHPAQDVVASE